MYGTVYSGGINMLEKKLKNLRIEKGCTLVSVAQEVGVSAASLSKYEHGIHVPGDIVLARLANFYGMTVTELLEETDGELPEKQNRTRMCPWRIKKGVDQRTGNSMTWFLPCLRDQCMAYEKGNCGMIRKDGNGIA